MSSVKQKPFDLRLERVALGETPGDGSEEEKVALAALSVSSRDILREIPVSEFVADVQRRRLLARTPQSERAPRQASRFLWAVGGAIALAVALVWVTMAKTESSSEPTLLARGEGLEAPSEVRSKGDGRLLIQRKTAEGASELRPNALVDAGDLLQLSYLSGGQLFGVVFSVDGRGVITQHFPEDGAESSELIGGGRQLLPSSYELDDAPRFERFYFVTASEPFSALLVSDAIASLQGDGKLALGDDFKQYVFALRKASL